MYLRQAASGISTPCRCGTGNKFNTFVHRKGDWIIWKKTHFKLDRHRGYRCLSSLSWRSRMSCWGSGIWPTRVSGLTRYSAFMLRSILGMNFSHLGCPRHRHLSLYSGPFQIPAWFTGKEINFAQDHFRGYFSRPYRLSHNRYFGKETRGTWIISTAEKQGICVQRSWQSQRGIAVDDKHLWIRTATW